MTLDSVASSTRASTVLHKNRAAKRELAKALFVDVNFNGIAGTLVCLDCLAGQTCQDFAVLEIDNGSRADDLSGVGPRFPALELIALEENLGWAGGNNVGLRLASNRGSDYVGPRNNDTILAPQLVAAAGCIGDQARNGCLIAEKHTPPVGGFLPVAKVVLWSDVQ